LLFSAKAGRKLRAGHQAAHPPWGTQSLPVRTKFRSCAGSTTGPGCANQTRTGAVTSCTAAAYSSSG